MAQATAEVITSSDTEDRDNIPDIIFDTDDKLTHLEGLILAMAEALHDTNRGSLIALSTAIHDAAKEVRCKWQQAFDLSRTPPEVRDFAKICEGLAKDGPLALVGLYDAFAASQHIPYGISQQPRCVDTIAENYLDDEFNRCHEHMKIAAAELLKLDDDGDMFNREERARVVIDWEFRSGNNLAGAAATMGALARARKKAA